MDSGGKVTDYGRMGVPKPVYIPVRDKWVRQCPLCGEENLTGEVCGTCSADFTTKIESEEWN